MLLVFFEMLRNPTITSWVAEDGGDADRAS
jgi:hypothetical protein